MRRSGRAPGDDAPMGAESRSANDPDAVRPAPRRVISAALAGVTAASITTHTVSGVRAPWVRR